MNKSNAYNRVVGLQIGLTKNAGHPKMSYPYEGLKSLIKMLGITAGAGVGGVVGGGADALAQLTNNEEGFNIGDSAKHTAMGAGAGGLLSALAMQLKDKNIGSYLKKIVAMK